MKVILAITHDKEIRGASAVGAITEADLELPFNEFAARFLEPMWEQVKHMLTALKPDA